MQPTQVGIPGIHIVSQVPPGVITEQRARSKPRASGMAQNKQETVEQNLWTLMEMEQVTVAGVIPISVWGIDAQPPAQNACIPALSVVSLALEEYL